MSSKIPTKWATVCVEYGNYDGQKNGRLECCDSASFTMHHTEIEAMNWVKCNVSAGQMVAVLKVTRLFEAQAIELKDE
jgi:hypothetical protein